MVALKGEEGNVILKNRGRAYFRRGRHIACGWVRGKKNLRAIAFHPGSGVAEFRQHVFKLGNEEQTDLMMRLQLV